MKRTTTFFSGLVVAAVLAACGGPPPPPPPPPGPDPDSLAAARAREDSIRRAEQARLDSIRRAEQARADSIRRAEEAARQAVMRVRDAIARRVHFDFNRAQIRPGADTEVLQQKLALLQANSAVRIRIEGHCDERGSDEYNLALGMRRAEAAKQWLVSRGIDAGRIETVSFGEERPLVNESNEQAWSQNRRDEFVIIAGGDNLAMPPGME